MDFFFDLIPVLAWAHYVFFELFEAPFRGLGLGLRFCGEVLVAVLVLDEIVGAFVDWVVGEVDEAFL